MTIQSVAIVYQKIENGVPVMACLTHPVPFDPTLCRADTRIPDAVMTTPIPEWWDGWLDLGNGWFAARIDLEPALVAAMLAGAGSKADARTVSRQAIARIQAEADAVLTEQAPVGDRHNPDLDNFMSA